MPTRHRTLVLGALVVGSLLAATAIAPGADAAPRTAPTAILQVTVTGPAGEVAPGVVVSGSGVHGTTDRHGALVVPVFPTAVTQVCGSLTADSPLGGATGWASTCTAVTVTRGTTTDVRLVMRQGAAFSGRVTDARTGEPVVKAVIDHPIQGESVVGGARTNSNGVYTFRNLTPGPAARRQVNISDDFIDAYPASAPWGYGHVLLTPTVALRAGVVTTAGFDTVLVPTVRITGTVTDPAGAGVANADLVARTASGSVPWTTTNSLGRYVAFARWDQTGKWCASASPAAGRPAGLRQSCRTGVFGQGVEVAADFRLGTGLPPPVTPNPGETAVLSITVVSSDGTPVSGIGAGQQGVRIQRTDARGHLLIAVGTDFRTVCAYPDPADPRGGPTGYGGGCVDVTPVRAETTTARIVLGAGAGFGGRITDARTGAGVAGAGVFVSLSGENGFPTATADATGAYRFRGYPSTVVDRDTIGVTGAATGAAPWGYADDYPAGAGEFPLRPGVLTRGVDFTLVPNVRVTGTVTDDTGRRVADASLTVRIDATTLVTTTTNSAGDYLIIVPWTSTGPVCAVADPDTAHPHGLARQCRSGLFRRGTEASAPFALRPVS